MTRDKNRVCELTEGKDIVQRRSLFAGGEKVKGSGIKRVLNICRDYGVIRPLFEEIFDGFRVTLFKANLNDTDRDTDHDTDRRLGMIISIVGENSKITTNELANKCAVSQITIKRDIEKLKAQNRLRRVGSEKGGHWEIVNSDKSERSGDPDVSG